MREEHGGIFNYLELSEIFCIIDDGVTGAFGTRDVLYIGIYFAAIQQPTAMMIEAIMNIIVTGSPNMMIDKRAPMNGASA